MEELFPQMVKSLSSASTKIETEAAKLFSVERIKLSDDQWNEYGDNLRSLQNWLMQLNNTLHFEYSFEEGLPTDVINYSKLLEEYQAPCEEKVGFLLSRDDSWSKYENIVIEEILNGIIENSDQISALLRV